MKCSPGLTSEAQYMQGASSSFEVSADLNFFVLDFDLFVDLGFSDALLY